MFFSLPIGILKNDEDRTNQVVLLLHATPDAWNLNLSSNMVEIIAVDYNGDFFFFFACFLIENLVMILHVEKSVRYSIYLIKHMK